MIGCNRHAHPRAKRAERAVGVSLRRPFEIGLRAGLAPGGSPSRAACCPQRVLRCRCAHRARTSSSISSRFSSMRRLMQRQAVRVDHRQEARWDRRRASSASRAARVLAIDHRRGRARAGSPHATPPPAVRASGRDRRAPPRCRPSTAGPPASSVRTGSSSRCPRVTSICPRRGGGAGLGQARDQRPLQALLARR